MSTGLLGQTPINKNFLSPLEFRFVIKRLPNVVYFLTECTLPNITLPTADVPTPFVNIPEPGDHIDFSPLDIDFKVDEDMKNWLEIFNWMNGLGYPYSGENDYKPLTEVEQGSGEGIKSDATLLILTNSQVPNIKVTFEDLWPTSLGSLSFNSKMPDVDYISSPATFSYLKYTVEAI